MIYLLVSVAAVVAVRPAAVDGPDPERRIETRVRGPYLGQSDLDLAVQMDQSELPEGVQGRACFVDVDSQVTVSDHTASLAALRDSVRASLLGDPVVIQPDRDLDCLSRVESIVMTSVADGPVVAVHQFVVADRAACRAAGCQVSRVYLSLRLYSDRP